VGLLLVQPCIPHVKAYEAVPPLSLLILAAAVRSTTGITPQIVDLTTSPAGDDSELVAALAASPAIVGFSTMTVMVPETLRLARLVKRCSPTSVVVVGGVHATLAPLDIISEPAVDFVLRGECDDSFPQLVAALLEGRAPTGLAGLVAHPGEAANRGGAIVLRDLDRLPFPAFDLLDLGRYQQPVAIVTSRGCPYDCVYCSAGEISGRSWRAFSVDRVLDDIERLIAEYGVRRINFADDVFTLSEKRVRAVCESILRRGIEIRWSCLARPDRVNASLLALMHEAGCRRLYFGAESALEASLRLAGRRYAPDTVAKAVALARAAGIEHVVTSFIIGFPEETPEDVWATLKFADSLDAFIQVHALTPFPGTPLAHDLDRLGVSIRDPDYGRFNCQHAVIETPKLTRDKLQELLVDGLMLCYEHNRDRVASF
jgi:radical SAM superfamily enzyme YgiQ (UPF0313 family)